MKILCIVSICFTSLLLLLYPLVLMGNLMALAALPLPHSEPGAPASTIHIYLWTSTLYPVAYIVAIACSIWNLKKSRVTRALIWQAGLYVYLALTAGFLLFA